jgi:hypothetical protein
LAAVSDSDLGRSILEHILSIANNTLATLLSSDDAFIRACSLRALAMRSAVAQLIGLPV